MKVFADAGYWIALFHPRNPLHQKAIAVSQHLKELRIVTSEAVLTEFLNHFASFGSQFQQKAVQVVQSLQQSPDVEIVPQTSEQFEAALSLYAQRPDKAWGLTDCHSFHHAATRPDASSGPRRRFRTSRIHSFAARVIDSTPALFPIAPLRVITMLHPIYRVPSFQIIAPYTLRVEFDDNTEQHINFEPVLCGQLFGPLRDLILFNQVQLDSEVHTLVWPNGADFDPAPLHDWNEHA